MKSKDRQVTGRGEAVATADSTSVEWHHFDASQMILGQLASRVAHLLMGKHRVDYAPNRVAPVYVVVTNTDHVPVTRSKEVLKVYRHYTGYPGGLKTRRLAEQRQRDSRVIVRQAVMGMLPKNSLRHVMMTHLKLYQGADHPYQDQL